MKLIIAGAWQWKWYQEAFANALISLGQKVKPFGWAEFFHKGFNTNGELKYKNFYTRLQNRLVWGPLINQLNRQLVQQTLKFQPDVILAYNGSHITPSALKQIKVAQPEVVLAQYANDNPFSEKADFFLWQHLKRAVPYYDIHFVYRSSNKEDITQLGGKNIHLLRSYYIPEDDACVELKKGDERFISDVVFVGHYEPDNRVEYLEAVAAESAKLNIKFNLFGGGWKRVEPKITFESPLYSMCPIQQVFGIDYQKAISGTKIALCFLSKLNKDTYTRRCFQIPAMRTFLLSEYTEDLASLYEEGKEIEFFRSKQEMLDKIQYYLTHEDERNRIALNGYKRVQKDGHDVVSRAKQFLQIVETAKKRTFNDVN
jgi:spore maturation protein CgeB